MPRTKAAVGMTALLAVLFLTSAAASNWAINNIGRNNGLDSPHTVPIGWGLQAPSGVVLIGLMFAVRDSLHERIGLRGTLLLIATASAVSAIVAPPTLVVASGFTMLVAESSDALVYQRLRAAGRFMAAAMSNVVSSLLDSVLFLTVAFGAAAALAGSLALFIGKLQASLVVMLVLNVARRLASSPRLRDDGSP
ncbi:VUT family protein [Kribbella sp. NPDC051936]|uniref:VUT family protein n=1 Tax=Kribbella sp. NPDC051936 TaxID=3154946 RepID=UPI00342B8AFF